LSKHKGELNLSGLTSLSEAAAQALAKHKGDLRLTGLTSLSDAAAQALSRLTERTIYLCGLTEVSALQAASLAKTGRDGEGGLFLDGLTLLKDEVAFELAKYRGNYLSLANVKKLSDAAAESFANHEGELGLDGLESLSPCGIEHLANHQGTLACPRPGAIYLSGSIGEKVDEKRDEIGNFSGGRMFFDGEDED